MRCLKSATVRLVVVTGFALAATANAGGGNSANVRTCQANWLTLARTDLTLFNSEAECKTYTAKGGLLTTPACIATATATGVSFVVDWGSPVAGQAFARAHVVNESFRITAETPVTPTQTTASITVPGDFSAYLYWTVVAILDVTNEVGLATIPCALRIA